jgi:Cu(I)/Ag(I) efflux system membrane fusion protein
MSFMGVGVEVIRRLAAPTFPLLLGFALLLPACSQEPSESVQQARQDTPAEHAHKHLDPSYVCPMHPQIVRDAQGSCPICGMQLVEKAPQPVSEERPEVILSNAVVQNMGVRTAAVERGTLWKYIRTQGTVAYDEDRILQIHTRAEGWIENLYVESEGERVERGEDLADFVSPTILWAQLDFLKTLEDEDLSSFDSAAGGDTNAGYGTFGSRELLRYLKVPERYLNRMEDTRQPRDLVPIKAPQGGVITMLGAREGMYVDPETTLFTIVDLSEVWVMVDIYEHQIAWVRPGLEAEISTPAYPGRRWKGEVEFVYPEVHPTARTLRARLEFANPDELLLPNMFVEVVIYGGPKQQALIVPREALIVTGERETVIKSLGNGRFQPVEVVSGMWRGKQVEILSGLAEGDEIVVSGQFLIDSESSLNASFMRMSE